MAEMVVGKATTPRERVGAPRAKPGEYFFDPAKIPQWVSGPDYSAARGCYVIGEHIILALQTMPAGSGADPHSHLNEQWMYVLDGEADITVGGQSSTVRAGQIVYIPAETIHSVKVTSTIDLRFLAAKDTNGDVSATHWEKNS